MNIKLVQVTLCLACIRGVFFSRIYVVDSRRDSVFTYFGKWGMTDCTRHSDRSTSVPRLCKSAAIVTSQSGGDAQNVHPPAAFLLVE